MDDSPYQSPNDAHTTIQAQVTEKPQKSLGRRVVTCIMFLAIPILDIVALIAIGHHDPIGLSLGVLRNYSFVFPVVVVAGIAFLFLAGCIGRIGFAASAGVGLTVSV